VLNVELGREHVNEIVLRDEAQVHEAFSQLRIGLLLFLEALLELVIADEALVFEQLADAFALFELDLRTENALQIVVGDILQVDKHGTQAHARALVHLQGLHQLLVGDHALGYQDFTEFFTPSLHHNN
jgi:hypothetical protein